MIKRELKINLKSFILWFIILAGLFGTVFAMYPTIAKSEDIQLVNEMMNAFPKELLMAFNMDLTSIDHAYGWLKSEGFVLILLVIGCYSGMLGSQIVLKEESDKTIEYLHSLPVSRNYIILSKVFVGLFYIILLVLCVGIVNYIGLTYNGEFDHKQFIYLSMTPLLSSLPLFAICLFLSTFSNKTSKMIGVSLGVVFVSYILQIISMLSKEVEIIKYLSVFTLSDIRNIITVTSFDTNMVLISLAITFIFILLSVIRYNTKELV